MNTRNGITTLLCFQIILVFSRMSAGEQTKDFAVSSGLSNGWMISYVPDAHSSTRIDIDGKPHILFAGEARLDGNDHTGEPLLPVDVVTLGVPADGFLDVELLDPVYELIENQLVAPYPTYEKNDEEEPVAVHKKTVSAYAQNRFFPSLQVIVDPPMMLRDQRIASVRISPYQYNPATKTLRRLSRATLRVTMRSENGGSLPLPPETRSLPDPFFEEIYRGTMLNYRQAKGWRDAREKSEAGVPPDSTRDWFETGKYYYKMPIANDGWYKVTKAQLVAAGANPATIDLPTLKIFERGRQIPIVVRPDTSVEFYGRRNHGDSTYTDFFTDTSAYWLTWGGAAGLRYTPSFVDSTGVVETVTSAFMTRHFEQNNYYFAGTTQADVINIETTPGEGWAWGNFTEWFFPGGTKTFPFALDNIATSTSSQARIRVRLVSTTLNYVTPNHRARFWANDSLVGEVTFAGRSSVVFNATLPNAWLRNGSNQLRIFSDNTGAVPNQFYLDWFELDFERTAVPEGNQILLTVLQPGSPGKRVFSSTPFSSQNIDVFDLFGQRTITGKTISPTESGYALSFRDSLSIARTYMAVDANGAIPVPYVTRRMFSDIRVNTQGADYLIITHKNFLTAAQQLAVHRAATNAVRTKVVDVEEIYDEFNYGVMNATVLKTFVKHAYLNWSAPRPTYLVMLGDACWDFHRFISSTTNTNFVPSYGVPVSDNWFVSFDPDTTNLPSMLVGRIPVQSTTQAQQVIQKIIGYDSYTLSEWNKKFLFITGGNDAAEQSQFNFYSETLINQYVIPPPIGGIPFRVYKTTRGVIDGEHKARLKSLVKDGLLYMNFIGHSGGRVWGVDIGPPLELENTNGKLPFLSSVSCNVGGFADPYTNVLAEDFLLADNRGSVGSWASSSLGYPSFGRELLNDFLQGVHDTLRTFGSLTTRAKIRMVRLYGIDGIARSTVNTNNLIGDPLSRLALPIRPDLAANAENITVSNVLPTPTDSLISVKVRLSNYGLVPSDSVGVTIADTYNGITTPLLTDFKLPPLKQVDSVTIGWRATQQVGLHTITANVDPTNRIVEVSELNNIASKDQYIYANLLAVVKPLRDMVVSPGPQRLVVTSPIGVDSAGFAYEFQLDTVDSFNSPALISSGTITPTPVTGEWLTPSLVNNRLYFWRSRTVYGTTNGRWVESSFSTSSSVPVLPRVRVREYSAKQFRRDILTQTSVTDSGVTITPSPLIDLYVRSVGYRYNQLAEYYSIIRANEEQIKGYFFEGGAGIGFIANRIDEFTGVNEFRAFNTAAFPSDSGRREVQRMLDFITEARVGTYFAFSVIFDGSTNMSPELILALQQLGSTRAGTVQPGQSWAFIARKGNGAPGMPPLESVTDDTAIVRLQVPITYRFGKGSIANPPMTIPSSWEAFRWQQRGVSSTSSEIAFLGIRPNGPPDTLGRFPKDSVSIDLRFLNPLTAGERYIGVQTATILSTSDALVTPVLEEWSTEIVPPADLAISARTLASFQPTAARNVEVTVFNVGYQDADSSTVVLSVYDRQNRARQLASVSVLPIVLASSRTVTIPISTSNLPRRAVLQAAVIPAKKAKDLVLENNTAFHSFDVPPSLSGNDIQVYANEQRIMDGDYISASPLISLVMPKIGDQEQQYLRVQFFVDERLDSTWNLVSGSNERPTFAAQLRDGSHNLKFIVARVNSFGEVDSARHVLAVRVSRESRIAQLSNYPNPFARETYITLMLAGTLPPEELTLRIFTVSGRKIREISIHPSSLQIGFNRIYWDGRDEDGDEVANGYYFYQVSMKGEGKMQSEIQKLVKLR